MNIAVVYHRFGPPHIARLNEANKINKIIGIEINNNDRSDAWKEKSTKIDFEHYSLFNEDINNIPYKKIKKRIKELFDVTKPEVVAVMGWYERGRLAFADYAICNNIPVIVMSDSCETDYKRFFAKEWIKKKILKNFTAAIAAGKLSKQYLCKLKFPEEMIATGFDVVDNIYFYNESIKYKKENSEKYFLTVSRLIEKKNIKTLIRAYKDYYEYSGNKSWKLKIIGDGPQTEELILLVNKLDLKQMVSFEGYISVETLPEYYANAGVFVLSSLYGETWGMVVNEAMASGLPVIVSNKCGCHADLVYNRENGYIFNAEKVNELLDCMKRITSDDADLIKMGKRSFEIISDWGPERFACSLNEAAKKSLKKSIQNKSLLSRIILKIIIIKGNRDLNNI